MLLSRNFCCSKYIHYNKSIIYKGRRNQNGNFKVKSIFYINFNYIRNVLNDVEIGNWMLGRRCNLLDGNTIRILSTCITQNMPLIALALVRARRTWRRQPVRRTRRHSGARVFFPVYGGDDHFDDADEWTVNTYKVCPPCLDLYKPISMSELVVNSVPRSVLVAYQIRLFEPGSMPS